MPHTPTAGHLAGSQPYIAPFEADAPEPDDDLAIVPTSTDPNQLELRLPGSKKRPEPQRRRYSSYEWPIVDFIAGSLVVTVHQVLYRFALYDAKHPSPIRAQLNKLQTLGLVDLRRLDPGRGRASRHVAVLTNSGWRHIGRTPQASPLGAPRHVLEHCLQLADFRIEHEARGWVRIADPDASWDVLHAWCLRAARHRRLHRSHPLTMRRIENMPRQAVPCDLWLHLRTGAVLLTLPSRKGINLDAKLDELPNLGLWPVLPLHLIGADPKRAERDTKRVRAWMARRRRRFTLVVPPPFDRRPYPDHGTPLPRSLYDAYGTLTPRAMPRLPLIGAYGTRVAKAHQGPYPMLPGDLLDLAETRLRRPNGP